MRMDRRSFLKVAGGVTLIGALVGCTGGGEMSGGGTGGSGGFGGNVPDSGSEPDEDNTPGGNEEDTDDKKKTGFYAAEQADAAGVRWTYYYNANTNTASLAGYKESGAQPSGKVTLPSVLDGIRVTSVKWYAFNTEPSSVSEWFELCPEEKGYTRSDFSKVTEMIVPESIVLIEQDAFNACVDYGVGTHHSRTSLRKVTFLGKSVSLGMGAFYYCDKLEEIIGAEKLQCVERPIRNTYCFEYGAFEKLVVYDGLMAVSNFAGCTKLQKVWIADGVTEILNGVFNECLALQEIYIPASVQKIEMYAFNRYEGGKPKPSLRNIYFGGTQKQWLELMDNTESGNIGITGATDAILHLNAKMTDLK